MVVIPLQFLQPLRQEGVNGLGLVVVKTPVGELAPNDIAHTVTVVQIALFKDLLMGTCSVEAHIQRQLNILHQILIRRCGVNAVGIEALIQNQPLEHGFFIDEELKAVQTQGAQAKIALHLILTIGQLHIVESTCAGLPKMLLCQLNSQHLLAGHLLHGGRTHGLALVSNIGGQISAAHHVHRQHHLRIFGVGIVLHILHIVLRREFQPYRLPNAGGAAVETAVRAVTVALLSAGDQRIPIVIQGIDGDHINTGGNILGDLQLEGNIAALVATHLLAVDVHHSLVVHSTKVNEHPAGALLLCQFHRSLVPQTQHKVLVVYTGQLALRAKRHGNGAGQLCIGLRKTSGLAAAAVIDFKIPLTIQVQPAVALKLGLRMFGAGNVHNCSLLYLTVWM